MDITWGHWDIIDKHHCSTREYQWWLYMYIRCRMKFSPVIVSLLLTIIFTCIHCQDYDRVPTGTGIDIVDHFAQYSCCVCPQSSHRSVLWSLKIASWHVDHHRFITLSVDLSVEHYGRDAARRAGWSVAAELLLIARCTIVQSMVLRSHVVCLSVHPSVCLWMCGVCCLFTFATLRMVIFTIVQLSFLHSLRTNRTRMVRG